MDLIRIRTWSRSSTATTSNCLAFVCMRFFQNSTALLSLLEKSYVWKMWNASRIDGDMEILGSSVEMCLARNSRIAAASDSTELELDV